MSRSPLRARAAAAVGAAVLLTLAVAGTAAAAPAQPSSGDPQVAMAELDSRAQGDPNARSRGVPAAVAGWWIDPATEQVVVNVVGARTAETDAFTEGIDPSVLRVEPNSAPAEKYADLVGGQAILAQAGGRCSIGFSATDSAGTAYVITAGHCTELGGTWNGANGTAIGPVERTNFPGSDFGSIRVENTAAWTPSARVENGPTVRGAVQAGIGADVCRSGSTTGYRCGVVQSRNQTVNYGGGDVVYGLVRTSACAEPGDSGGTYITPQGQAQGMTSGGSGDCSVGGTTYFEPVTDALEAYGLTLVTG
ncbi:S1 family peptidase [Pseudonocardia spirodelae]|uniref:S1 family peptidase n=1 Tax=Pseudonocardia spirodelae TaxID=3133431 RepID=A0ABU8TAF7_9PSEU